MSSQHSTRPRCLTLGILIGGFIACFPASLLAQDEELEEIVVTGSRIQRGDLTANSPIAIIEAQQFTFQNTTNVEEYLRDLPQFVAGVGSNGNNGNDGSATLDLRNLGEERTLVLVDGKRFVPYDYQGFVDLGMIPASLIERVEIVTGGASAVYGSDAVGGVVNFIMKDDFNGIAFDSSYVLSEEGDGDRADFSLTVGGNFDDKRGNIVMNFGYTNQDEVTQGARDFSLVSLSNLLAPEGSFTQPTGTLLGSFPTVDLTGEGLVQFDNDGNLVNTTNTFNFNPFNLLQVPQQKWTGTTLVGYEVTDNVEFFGRGSFANNQIDTIIAPTGTFFSPFQLNVDNPFLSPQAQAVFAAQDAAETAVAGAANQPNDGIVDVTFGRRLTELGTRDSRYENTAYQFVAGLRGELGNGFAWEGFGQWGRTTRTQNFINDVSFAGAQQAMLAVQNPDGSITCMDSSNGCMPANFFGEGNLSPEAADFIRLNLNENNKTTQLILGGSITGELPAAKLPTAENGLAIAVGLEYREEDAENLPDANYAGGNSIGFGSSSPVDAQIEVSEFFLEAQLPLLENAPFARALTLETGVRFADYENTIGSGGNDFTNTSWKAGGEWAVNDTVRFRGLFQRAVRAPTLREIGLPLTPSTGDLTSDPCEGTNPVGDPVLEPLCLATGVPTANLGTVTSIISGQINNFVGGNAALEPEEADTVTFGFVITPESIPLTVAADWYQIEVNDAIRQVSEQAIIDACYKIEQDPDGQFCSLIARNPLNGSLSGGNETGVDVSLVNSAVLEVSGIDINVSYSFDLNDWGTVDLGLAGVYVIKAEQQEASFTDVRDCAGLVGTTCVAPDPEKRFIQTTQWERGPLAMQLRWQFLSDLDQDAITFGLSPASDFASPGVDSANYFDLSATYELFESTTLRAGVLNLLDEAPPLVGNSYGGTLENSGNTFPATYDPLGRAFFFGFNVEL